MRLPWQIDSPIVGLLLIVAANVLAIVGLLATRRLLRRLDMISHHEVGGFLLSVVGTIYAVILGLIVVDSLAKFQLAREMTEREANALASLVLLSNHLPPEQRDRVHGLAVAYADHVMNREWSMLDDGKSDPEAQATALRLIEAITDFEPKTGRQQATYEKGLDAVGEFWNARRYRVVTAAQSVPGAEWFLLIAGGMITVTFTYFFKLDHTRVHVAMTSLVATIIALNLYMVLMFGYPYSGEVKVSSDSFGVAGAIITHHSGLRSAAGP
jgi:hypothetical protein